MSGEFRARGEIAGRHELIYKMFKEEGDTLRAYY